MRCDAERRGAGRSAAKRCVANWNNTVFRTAGPEGPAGRSDALRCVAMRGVAMRGEAARGDAGRIGTTQCSALPIPKDRQAGAMRCDAARCVAKRRGALPSRNPHNGVA